MKDLIIKFADTVEPTIKPVGPDNDPNFQQNFNDSVINIINAVIGVLGLVAVLVVIIGGIGYMTSAGDAAKVKKAKDTILYGLLGLAICGLSFAIVNFVITNIIN